MGDSLTVDWWAETKPSIPVTCDLNNILFGATRRVLKSRSKWTWFFLQGSNAWLQLIGSQLSFSYQELLVEIHDMPLSRTFDPLWFYNDLGLEVAGMKRTFLQTLHSLWVPSKIYSQDPSSCDTQPWRISSSSTIKYPYWACRWSC